jgi:flagellar export protein FliJ
VKRYRFGLSPVLRFRRAQEEAARAAMLAAQEHLEQATAELDARLAAIGAARPDPSRRRSHEFQAERDQLRRHADAVTAARAAEANALAAYRISRHHWEEAARRVRALERLDERQRRTWTLEATRTAQAATDEIAQNHHGRSRP